jgi:GT2 family glycosyltransferase
MRRSLAAVEATLDRPTLEVIVVDNGSTDGTAQLDTEFAAASFLRLPKNFGRTKALNIGIRTAKGEYVLLAEPGTEWAPDAIRQLTARLDADNDVAAICPFVPVACRLPDKDRLYAEWKGTGALDAANVTDSNTVEYPRSVPILVRRRFLAGMRYLDERFGDTGYDVDLCRQLRTAGKKIVIAQEVQMTIPARPRDNLDAIESVDELNTAAAYAGKYFGTWAGMSIRVAASLHVLGKLLTLTRPGYNFKRLTGIMSGQKIDGEQEP